MNKFVYLNELFEIEKSTKHDCRDLQQDPNGINFISRSKLNNGIWAKVKAPSSTPIYPAGCITVSGKGNAMHSFVQPKPFIIAKDVFVLIPKLPFSLSEKLYICMCLTSHSFRFPYGKVITNFLPKTKIPALEDFPKWLKNYDLEKLAKQALSFANFDMETTSA